MYYLIDLCCICLNNKDPLQYLFDVDTDNITYFIKLTSCVPEMCLNEMNDRRLICKTCCENIEVIYKFRQKCLRSKTTLKSYVSQLRKVSNIRGEVNVYLIDLYKSNLVKKEGRNDNIKTELFEDVDNDTNGKEHSEIKSECSAIDLKLTDSRPNYIEFENVVIKMENENQYFEPTEKTFEDPLGNRDKVDVSHNIELAAGEIKKEVKSEDVEENQNQAVEEYLQESFDNSLETFDSENIEIKFEENLENCSEDFLLNPDKIDIVHNNIELMDIEINYQCKSEDIEELTNEDLDSPLEGQNVYNADKNEILFYKTLEVKPAKIVPSTSKDQDIGSRKVFKTIRRQIYECSVCPKKFSRASSLTVHVRIHIKDNLHVCCKCTKIFKGAEYLSKHMKIHTTETPYECNVCKKKFSKSKNLTTHMLIHTGEKPYECKICKKKFRQSIHLSCHMLIHTGEMPYECNYCKKKFRHLCALSSHMLTHTGEKPYECNICKKTFRYLSHRSRHMIIHTGEKPYPCKICEKQFRQSIQLANHMFVHTLETPVECTVCKKKFKHSSYLSSHMLVHTGKKPHECYVCKKKFTRRSYLSSHMLIHKGPYECNICNKKFRQSKSLYRHMLVHRRKTR